MTRIATRRRLLPLVPSAMLLGGLLLPACSTSDGEDGAPGPPGPPGGSGPAPTQLTTYELAPGVNVTIVEVRGGTASGGSFRVGDSVEVEFTLMKDDGSPWDISEMNRTRALVSGPTFNYQRVLAEQSDLITEAVDMGEGTYVYTFPDPIPATYLPPYNDTDSFDADDGELAGMPLLAGTYTLGMYFRWAYEVEGESFRDVGNAEVDFLFGGATTIESRELVTQANCNRCHSELQAHGGQRRDVTLCLLCHTAGSEDRNVASAAGGTPGASVDFGVMVHKIHTGAHLPSVLGVGTFPNGARDYEVDPEPYQLVGFGDSVHDYSTVVFPAWPALDYPMPRDGGYSALSDDEQDLEDEMRSGLSDCTVCHGDPDGAGPLPAPAQGDLIYTQPTRKACGSCHDDIDWDLPYSANGSTMPVIEDDAGCLDCHPASDNPLSAFDAHRHPMLDPMVAGGLSLELLDVAEAGMNDGDDTFDAGERMQLTFNIVDGAGVPVSPATLSHRYAVLHGPTINPQQLRYASLPAAALTGGQPYVINLPERVWFERVDVSTVTGDETFTTARVPNWNVEDAETVVYLRDGVAITGDPLGSTLLAASAPALQNFIDVDDSSGFERDEFIVIDDGMGGLEEYLQIQWVDGDRLWFSSEYSQSYPPGTTRSHLAGATVLEVELDELTEDTHYSIDAETGEITELVEFGGAATVIATYVTDWVVPDVYPQPFNASPDLGEEVGEWAGKSLVDGTYRLTMWASRSFSLSEFGESTGYRDSAPSVFQDVLFGDAEDIEPYDLVSDDANCYACHVDMYFHGGSRRGFQSCLACHGTAGAEDRPQYVAANAPDTTGQSVTFRSMLHQLHHGEELADASAFEVIGFGQGYPDNFSVHTYEEVVFPALPDGTKNCASCHGEGSETWLEPVDRAHPTEAVDPLQTWAFACLTCHDAASVMAHALAQTVAGVEACDVCHGEGAPSAVEVMHRIR